MSKNHEQEIAIRSAVRDIIAISPLASSHAIAREVAKKLNIPVSNKYILTVMKKASNQAIKETEMAKALPDLAQTGELFRVIIDRLNKIIFAKDEDAKNIERIMAAEQVAFLKQKFFVMMQDAGIYKKAADEIIVTHALAPEMARFMENVKNWGMMPVTLDAEEANAPEMVDAAIIELPNGESSTPTNEPTKIFATHVDSPEDIERRENIKQSLEAERVAGLRPGANKRTEAILAGK